MGNLDWAGEYRLQLLLISDDQNRAEHGFHIHVMRGNQTLAKIDLMTLEYLDNSDKNLKKGDARFIKQRLKQNWQEYIQKAKQMRKK